MIALVRDTLAGGAAPDASQAGRLVAAGCAGAAAFGAVAGSLAGGPQILSSALKLPLVLLLPVMLCLPVLAWLRAWSGAPVGAPVLVLEGARAVARIGATLLLGVPLVWLAWRLDPGHAAAVRLVSGLVAGAFLVSARGLFAAAELGLARRLAMTALLALTLGQTSWILRPFVGAPDVAFRWFEPPSGDFVRGVVDPMYLERGP